MTAGAQPSPRADLIPSIIAFLRDYAATSGRKGLTGAMLVLLGALFEGVGLALIAPLLAILFNGKGAGGSLRRLAETVVGWFGATSDFGRLSLLLGIFAVAMVIRAIVLLARDITLAQLRIGFVDAQRIRVAEALAAAEWSHVTRLRHARVIQVISGEIQQIGTAAYFLVQCVTAVAMLTAQCILAFYLSWPLALLSVGLLVLSFGALLPLMRRSHVLGRFLTESIQRLLHDTTQFLGGLKLAVSQNLQGAFLSEFRAALTAQSTRQVDYLRQQTEVRLLIATVSALVGAALVLVGLSLFHVAPPILVALLLVVSRMSGPSGQIQQGAQMVANALPAYEAVQSLRRELEVHDRPAAADDGTFGIDGEIRFEGVCFVHPQDGAEGAHGVQDITLSITPGMCLGIKGPSGSGKTTIADLLAGLNTPQSGSITVGGKPLTGGGLKQWRNGISYVAQDPFLFHDTIRRNLTWANPKAGEVQLWQALDCAEAGAFVRAMPAGLDTVVGERGTLVSGGERQRLALARALLRKPSLLILDEATNALDSATENAVLDRIVALSPRPTVVIIAHRPDSLARCDRVVTMANGRLA